MGGTRMIWFKKEEKKEKNNIKEAKAYLKEMKK